MIRLEDVLDAHHSVSVGVERLASEFLSSDYKGPKVLLGRNEHSAALLACIHVDLVADDISPGGEWNGKPVVRSADLPANAIVVNCSMSVSPVTALRRLRSLKLRGSLNYADLCKVKPDSIPLPAFVSEMRKDLSKNGDHWASLAGSLADAESQSVLKDVMHYRLTADPLHMCAYSVRFADQYFEDFLALRGEIFVDAGGFNGDTTEEFCRRYPDYRKVILFEPSGRNMLDAKTRLASHRDIQFVEQGLSDTAGTLWFNPDAGSASAVSATGSCSIDVTTLDASIGQCVTFVKMDLEGWELRALQGSRRHILEDHPKLAVAVYHRASDFWRIPEYVAGVRDDYDIYLRHYTEGWSETVMSFVPR